MLGVAGSPMHFSLVVPSQFADRAHEVLGELER